MASKSVDEDSLLFVSPPPDYLQLKCPICLEFLLDRSSHLVVCCGNHICASCIGNLTHKPCPLCKAVIYNTVPDKGHQRAVNCLKVYCTHKEKGCQWSGELKQLSHHVSRNGDCQYEELQCKYECGHKKRRSLVTDHETNSCPLRPGMCRYCQSYKGTYEQITKSHHTVCSSFPVPCTNGCGQSIKRSLLADHVTKECILHKVSCEFVEAGCKWTGTKNELPQHLTDDWRHHIAFATLHTSKQFKDEVMVLKQEMKELKLQNDTLHQRVLKLEEVRNQLKLYPLDKPHPSNESPSGVSLIPPPTEFLKSRSPNVTGNECLLDVEIHNEPALVLSSKGDYIFMTLPDIDQSDTTTLIVDRWEHKRIHNNLHRTSFPYCNLYTKRGLQVTVHCNGIRSGNGSHVSVGANVLKIIDKDNPFWSFGCDRKVSVLESFKRMSRQFRGNLLITLQSHDPHIQSRYGVITFDKTVDPKYCREGGLELGIDEFISFDEVIDNYLGLSGSLHFKIQYYPLEEEDESDDSIP